MNAARRILCIIGLLIGLLFGPGQAIAQKQLTKMTIGYSASGGQYINLFTAKELGIFEKHGIDATLNQINSSAQVVASLRSASVNIATGPCGPVIDAIAKGVTDFTFFGEAMPHTVLEVWGQPSIKSVDRKSTRLNSSHRCSSYAVFCLQKK